MRFSQKIALLAGAICTVVTVCISLSEKDAVWLEGLLFDGSLAVRSSLSPRKTLASNVAVVSFDLETLKTDELKHRPRGLFGPTWGKLIPILIAAEAKVINFDLIFEFSADGFRDEHGNKLLSHTDLPFKAALSENEDKLVLAYSAETRPAIDYEGSLSGDLGAFGIINHEPDADAVFRQIPVDIVDDNGQKHATLLGAALQRAGVQKRNRTDGIILAPAGHPEEIIPTYKLENVLDCAGSNPEALKEAFKDRVVFIGWTGPELDRKLSSARFIPAHKETAPTLSDCGLRRMNASVPAANNVPGVHLWALAAEAALSNQLTRKAGPSVIASVSGMAAIAGTAIGFLLAPVLAFIAIVFFCLGFWALQIGLVGMGLWLPVGLSIISTVVAAITAYIIRFLLEEQKRRRIEKAFGHYLAPTLVDQLVESSGELKLGGETREITTMFADLSGFTALSSKLAPEELVSLTNKYLNLITQEVEATGGYVDKFIGDAVMAIWNAPVMVEDHAEKAVSASVGITAKFAEANKTAEANGEPSFDVKIGISSGTTIIGNVGSETRFNYTAIGEAVNIAARLENLPGVYGCNIVISEATASQLSDRFILREIDHVTVKGIEEGLPIYEPLNKASRDLAKTYALALARYRDREFAEAIAIWEGLDDGPSKVMASRARELVTSSPSHN